MQEREVDNFISLSSPFPFHCCFLWIEEARMSTEQYIKLIYIVKVEESSHQTGTGYTTDDDLFCKIDWIQMGKI